MSEQQDSKTSANLEQVSHELTRGLERCHTILDDYRAKLAANSNDPQAANEAEEDSESLHG